MHLILARRDLSGFQHLHPTMDTEGTWRIPLTFDQAGDYRAFADFQPQGRGEALTLGADVAVGGEYRPRPLPASARTSTVDGYTVDLDGQLGPGAPASRMTASLSPAPGSPSPSRCLLRVLTGSI